MQTVVLFVHLAVCVSLIGLVLLQRSEGGALGMGGGGGGALMSGRGAADALARMTSIAGGFFLVTSLSLTFLSGAAASSDGPSVFDLIPRAEQSPPAPAVQTPPARPDPTEGRAPQAEETRLASIATPPAFTAPPPVTIAPAPVTASTRAVPLRPTTNAGPLPAAAQRVTPQPTQRAATPVPGVARPPAQQRTAVVTNPIPATTRPLVLPNTSGAATGQSLTAPDPESVEVVEGVEAVRRQRAGPDQ